MAFHVQSRSLIGYSLDSPIGRVSVAGFIRHSAGIPRSNMRILGSYALVYVLHGAGRYFDERGGEQKITAGDLIVIFPEISHAYGPGPGEIWDEIYIVFDGPVFDLWRRRGLLDDAKPVRRLEPIRYWMQRIEQVTQSVGQSPLQIVCRLQQLLSEIDQYRQVCGLREADRAWLARAKSLLEQDRPFQEFNLESVARSLGISYVGFRKKFARVAGISPAKFHMKSVMDRACDLIRRQGPTNREVAERLGFCDEFHFSRRFKQVVGLTPREFRNRTALD